MKLPNAENFPRRLTNGWLMLALLSLGISVIFATYLVLSRTPFIDELITTTGFPVALVMHVDFAILVWFLSFAGVLWSLLGGTGWPRMGWGALILAIVGVMLMLVAALSGQPRAILSNYLPVLQDPLFFGGLILFTTGSAVMIVRAILANDRKTEYSQPFKILQFGAKCAAITAAISLAITLWSYFELTAKITEPNYFEQLFWGGGHLMQICHVLLMLVAWLFLAEAAGVKPGYKPSTMVWVFSLGVAPVFVAPFIQLAYAIDSPAYRHAYTQLMAYGSWPVVIFVGSSLIYAWWRQRNVNRAATAKSPLRILLLFSMLLFVVGLVSGTLIRADNVLVTAHYHGTTGAVTLAYMGLTYHLLPRLTTVSIPQRAIYLQGLLYGFGMLLLIFGLIWSGLHGVQRKTAGAGEMAANNQELIGMLLMGVGGLLALMATWLFLILIVRTLWPARQMLFGATPLPDEQR